MVILQPNFAMVADLHISSEFQDVGKGGLSLRGVAFITVLEILACSGEYHALPSIALQNTVPRGSCDVFERFRQLWRFRLWRLPPLKSTPLLRHPDNYAAAVTNFNNFWKRIKNGVTGTDLAKWIRRGRTWAIAVRRGSYKSLFLLNSGRFFP